MIIHGDDRAALDPDRYHLGKDEGVRVGLWPPRMQRRYSVVEVKPPFSHMSQMDQTWITLPLYFV